MKIYHRFMARRCMAKFQRDPGPAVYGAYLYHTRKAGDA